MIFVFSSPLHKNNNPGGLFPCVGSYQLTNPNDRFLRSLKYIHGLICLEDSKQSVIWNPTVKGFSILHKLQNNIRERDFLGYDPIDGKYKALRLLRHSNICIVTFGAQGASRIITKGFPSHGVSKGNWRCINGVIYYGAIVGVDVGFRHCIMSFDVRTEKFNPIKYPDDGSMMMIVHYEGRLAIVKKYFILSIDIWILMDSDGNEWTHKSFVLPGIDPIRKDELHFNGVSDAGEFVFAPWSFSESFYILYFDPRRNSIREALFEGNVGDEYRLRYGLDNIFMGYMKVFPNHIETLVSL